MFSTLRSALKVWLPTMPMTLVSARNAGLHRNASAVFRVFPRMTKHEVKEHLEKIYQLPVKKVNTMNYLGKRKKVIGNRGIRYFKYRDFKKAIVTFEDSVQDLGAGTRIISEGELQND